MYIELETKFIYILANLLEAESATDCSNYAQRTCYLRSDRSVDFTIFYSFYI